MLLLCPSAQKDKVRAAQNVCRESAVSDAGKQHLTEHVEPFILTLFISLFKF